MSLSRDSTSALACLFLFALISVLVLTGVTAAADERALVWFASLRTPGGISMMRGISWIGNWQGEVPLLLIVAGILWRAGRGTSAWRYLAVAAVGEVSWAVLKLLFHRPRPTIVTRLGDAGWYSYPSGHATLAPVIWGLGLILLSELADGRAAKLALRSLAAAVVLAIAISRLYLGVHYPTDVLGGLVLGGSWVLLWRRATVSPRAPARSG